MRIYDTLTRTKKPFEPLGSPVKIYFCGLTPKNFPHIGHAKLFVTADVIRRYLRYSGYDVLYVQNFTDIDDKTIAKGREEGVSYQEVSQRYTDSYFENMDALNCLRADLYPKATDAIPGIIAMVKGLLSRGVAYEVGGNVYFRVSSFPDYGKLSGRAGSGTMTGAGLRARGKVAIGVAEGPVDAIGVVTPGTSVSPGAGEGPATEDAVTLDMDEQYLISVAADAIDEQTAEAQKEDARDFALWKASKEDEPSWESPWGGGRPAWHIECSTMIYQQLGERIDIHGGGQDLIFPHHENEIAQSEAFTAVAPFVNTWVHIALLNITTLDGRTEKMAHSLGNFTTVNSILERYEAGVLRLYLLAQHYRTPATYDGAVLEETRQNWERLRATYSNVALLRAWPPYQGTEEAEPLDFELKKAGRRLREALDTSKNLFIEAMDDDFNTSKALVALFGLVADLNRMKDSLSSEDAVTPSAKGVIEAAFSLLNSLMETLGLPQPDISTGADERLTAEVERLLAERHRLRDERDFDGADGVRVEIDKLGVSVEDHPQGTVWRVRQ